MVRGGGVLGEKPSDGRASRFQKAFAELSSGRDWIRAADVRALLIAMGVILPPSAVRKLLEAFVCGAGEQRVSYEVAFGLYRHVLRPTGSQVVQDAIDDAVEDLLFQAAADGSRILPPAGRTFTPKPAEMDQQVSLGGAKNASPYMAVYQPPPALSPRGASVFKKVGRFCITKEQIA
mmetsp:Transcript_120486/g.246237  ORF Transcript_120486/g.246237 Transcript_120486/m.246237 type:complete len:177 (-) Transcript_120486:72-602(-)